MFKTNPCFDMMYIDESDYAYVSIHLMQRGWFESEPLTRSYLNRLSNVTKQHKEEKNRSLTFSTVCVKSASIAAEKSVEIVYSKMVKLNYAKCNAHEANIV